MFISHQTGKSVTEGQTWDSDNWPRRKHCYDQLEESQSLQNKQNRVLQKEACEVKKTPTSSKPR